MSKIRILQSTGAYCNVEIEMDIELDDTVAVVDLIEEYQKELELRFATKAMVANKENVKAKVEAFDEAKNNHVEGNVKKCGNCGEAVEIKQSKTGADYCNCPKCKHFANEKTKWVWYPSKPA